MATNNSLGTYTLAEALTATATTMKLSGSLRLATETLPFYMTLTPPGVVSTADNSEIVRVTAIDTTTSTYTIVRGCDNTTPKAFDVGTLTYRGVYGSDLGPIGNANNRVFLAEWQNETYTFSINDPELQDVYTGMTIFVTFDLLNGNSAGVPAQIAINHNNTKEVMSFPPTTQGGGQAQLAATALVPRGGQIYHLIYDGTQWVSLNSHSLITGNDIAENTITSYNVAYTTFDATNTPKKVGSFDGNDVYVKRYSGNVSIGSNRYADVSLEPTWNKKVIGVAGYHSAPRNANESVVFGVPRLNGESVETRSCLLSFSSLIMRIAQYNNSTVNISYNIAVYYIG